MQTEIPKFSNAHFRKIPENLLHFFDANLTYFLPEWKIYVSTEKIMEKFSEFFAEIPDRDRALQCPYFNVAGKNQMTNVLNNGWYMPTNCWVL